MKKLTIKDCLNMGFEKIPHFTIGNNLLYQLGRNRHLSIGSIGTPNEMLFICETNPNNTKIINEIICLHNYDYDGYITKEKLLSLINSIGKSL